MDMTATRDEFQKAVHLTERRLTEKINQFEVKLTEKIDQMKVELIEKIDQMKVELIEKIDQFSKETDVKLSKQLRWMIGAVAVPLWGVVIGMLAVLHNLYGVLP